MSTRESYWRPPIHLIYVGLCAPMVFLLFECVRGAYCDVQLIRKTMWERQIGELRSAALTRAQELNAAIQFHGKVDDLKMLAAQPWMSAYWKKMTLAPHELYAAVVDPTGRIVLHTDTSRMGKELENAWYQEAVSDAGSDVVRLQKNSLANDAAAYDVRIPLILDGRRIGDIHEGLDARWFNEEIAVLQRDVLDKWALLIALALVVDGAGVLALVALARRQSTLWGRLRRGPREWAGRLGQIAAGLAHEIRNPLHALRLNLHTLQRSISGNATIEPDELKMTIAQSNRAVDTLDSLMRDLLQFTSADGGKPADINLVSEIRATLNLMNDEMRRKKLEVHTQIPEATIGVRIDPVRLGEILADLIIFAQNNAGPGGSICIDVTRNGKMAKLDVSASGATLSPEQRTRVFEPFQAPRETASGLGLALVKHFSEDAGGSVACLDRQPGCRFCIQLPLASPFTLG